MILLALTLLFVLITLVLFLIFFIYKIWRNEGWRQGLVMIAYFIISNFITPIILNLLDMKDKGAREAVVIVFLALWDFGLFIYVRWKEY